MKTTDPARYFRNLDTPAARLARWQDFRPLRIHRAAARLEELRALPDYAGTTLAARRAYAMTNRDPAPELSDPDAAAPYLWTNEGHPAIANFWPGRDFLRHRGWYTDQHEDETLEACAVILADFPRLIFAAIRCSLSDTVRVLLDDWQEIDFSEAACSYSTREARDEAARDTIRSADSTAEREADDERRYQAEEDRKRQAEEARDDLKRNRTTVRALIADLRELCAGPIPSMYPAAASAVKRQLADLLRDRSDLFDQLKTLEA